ncbi:MAG: YfhO family protein [Candidatus Marinimicrobia bacterium]|nr:YfhO family protein [Candidatus Neomarinimicrobiota bacterium]
MTKRQKNTPNKTNNQSTDTLQVPKPSWQIWGVLVLIILAVVLFMYQDAVFKGHKLNIADVSSQGVIFDSYRTNFEKTYDDYPQWYPYIFCGMPFHASATYRIRYTLETLYKIVPSFIRSPLNASFTLNIFLGGLFMLLLLRSYGLGYVASLGGALAFILTTKLMGTPHTNRIVTFIHIPLIFYALRQLIETRKWIFIILLGGALGSQIGSYHPQIAYYTLLLIGLYSLYRIVQAIQVKESWQSMGSWVLMVAVSMGIAYFMASIVLMPMREYLPFSIRGAGGGGGAGGGLATDYATAWSFGWLEIFQFFLPSFSGFGGATYWGDAPFTSYPHYLGISVVVLAVIGFWKNRKHKDFWFWGILLVLSLLIALGKNFAVLSNLLLNYLPYFNKFREPSMILILFIFGTAILAGFGLQSVINKIRETDANPKWIKMMVRGLIAVGVLALIGVLFKSVLQSMMTGFYLSADEASGRLARFPDQRQIAYLYELRFEAFYRDFWIMLVFAAGVMGVIWTGLKQSLSAKGAGYLLVGLLVIDLAIPGRKVITEMFSPITHESMLPQKTAAIDFLQTQPGDFRVFPLDELTTNKYGYFEIASIGGYHAAKMANYQDMLDGNFLNNFNFLRMTNTRFLISKQQLQLPILQLVHKAGQENIYELAGALPRAWFVDSVVVASDEKQVLSILQGQDFSPAEEVILTETPDLSPVQNARLGVVKSIKHQPQYYEFLTSNEGQGVFVLSEAGYPPGWHAQIDGKDVKVYQANHILQAIAVPPGDHTITFQYRSKTFRLALWLSRILFYGVTVTLIGYAGWNVYQAKFANHL